MAEVRHICPHCGHGVGRLMRVKDEGVSNCVKCHKSDWSRRFPYPGPNPGPVQWGTQLDAILSRGSLRTGEPADVGSSERKAPSTAQRLVSKREEPLQTLRTKGSSEPPRAFSAPSGTQLPYAPHSPLHPRRLITAAAVVIASTTAIGLAVSACGATAETATRPAPATTVTVTATATATETVTASPAEPTKAQPVDPVLRSEPTEQPPSARTNPTPQSPYSDSPGRHDGSNYDNLSPEGQEAHDTLNCADVPGHKKGSCNEPNRKCNLNGAQVTSSGGIRLTCQMADDGRLRWLP